MRILFVADGRSAIALNWIEYFVAQGHEVHLASTFACRPSLALASLEVIPVAFSQFKKPPSPRQPAAAAPLPPVEGLSSSPSPLGGGKATGGRQGEGEFDLPSPRQPSAAAPLPPVEGLSSFPSPLGGGKATGGRQGEGEFREPSPPTPLPKGEGSDDFPSPPSGEGDDGVHRRGEGKGILWSSSLLPLRTSARQWLGPLTLFGASRQLAPLIQKIEPDLVHAMRIPYEGMLAALAKSRLGGSAPPLVVSVWGNDFTLHARANPWMAWLTRRTLHNSNALHTDCARDLRLAGEWGFDLARPAVVLPGAGGIQLSLFHPPQDESHRLMPIVINPRGFRAYVRNDTFFKAIPLVLSQFPTARFLCPTMQGEPQALRWLDEYDLHAAVTLLPNVPRHQMAAFFRQAQVIVSPSTHDGTPNTLLEAMACGCFPVAGDLESIREWITPPQNGLLVDPADPQALADAILRALREPDLRRAAAERNQRLIHERAEYATVMAQAEQFYKEIIKPQINTVSRSS